MDSEPPSDPDRSREPSPAEHSGSTVGPTSDTLTRPTPRNVSPSLERVWTEFQGPCTAQEIIETLVDSHTRYGKGRARAALSVVRWPAETAVRRQSVTDWYEDARSQLQLADDLNGRTAIVGMALAERATGRELVRAGLFALIMEDLREYHGDGVTILSARGRERLATIPLASLDQNTKPYVISAGTGHRAKLSPDGRRAVSFGGDEISLWQVDGSRRLHTVWAPRRVVMARVTSDGAWVVALLEDGSLMRWEAESLTGQEVFHNNEKGSIYGGDLAKDASCAAVRLRPTGFAVLTVGERVERRTDEPLTRITLGPDGRLIATETATTLEVYEWTGTELKSLRSIRLESELTSFDCGPTQVVAATSDGVQVIFGGEADRLSGLPLGAIYRVAVSADGSILAAVGRDSTYLVQPTSGVVLAELRFPGAHQRLSFSLNCRRFIASHDNGTARIWDVGIEPPPGRPPAAAYDSDVIDTDQDLLGRNRDVDAFASLIAAVAVQPPLSIGVFGDWGSGKSWFMRQVKRRVAEIAADAKGSGAPQRELSFYKKIAQVEFNAWHYAETDVLTGLVEHIFNRLDTGDTAGIVEQEKAKALRALADAEEKAGEKADQIRGCEQELAAIEARRREHEQLRKSREDQLMRDASEAEKRQEIVASAKTALSAIGWGSTADAFAGLIHDINAASDELRRANPILTPLGCKQGLKQRQRAWMFTLAGPVLGLLAGMVVWLVADRSVGLTALSSLGGLVTGIIVSVSGIVQKSTESARKSLDDLAEEKKKIEADIKEKLEGIDEVISKDRAEEEKVRGTLKGLKDQHQGLVNEVAEREKKLAVVKPERLLQDLIKARVSSGDYSRHLGVIAQARHDFEKVSDLIKAVNDSLTESSDSEDTITVNRIVLYIDDLDRCEPSKVATVLQAVHLLLAFPLFVVVVGVDSRWVGRALRKQYPELLAGGDVEPRDYLEKIFQIPFWLDRMDRTKTTRMLQGITSVGATAKPNGSVPTAPFQQPSSPPLPHAGDGRITRAPSAPQIGRDIIAQIARSRELNPRGLGIEDYELDAMEKLSDLLDRSPRSLKRFVNVYRLMKVRAPDSLDFSDCDRADADYLVVLLLLAEMIGRPDEAIALFNWIRQTTDTEIEVPPGWPRSTSLYRRWIDDVSRFGFDGLVRTGLPGKA
jgi:KAP family P-loop domain